MPITTFSSGAVITAASHNANWALAVLTDTARTITVSHSWTASQTFTGGWTAGAACTVSTGGLTVSAGGASITGGLTVVTGGAQVSAGGLTVSSGTTAVQALTATTISGTIITATTRVVTDEVRAAGATWSLVNSTGSGAFSINMTTLAVTFTAGITATTGTFSGAVSGATSYSAGKASLRTGASTSVSTATTIYTLSSATAAVWLLITGSDGTNVFVDIVISYGADITALTSRNSIGSSAVRTYTKSGTAVQLAMSSGTYTVRCTPLEVID